MSDTKKYTREALLKSEMFSHVQPDFLSVLLTKPEYTISEVKKIVKDYFEKESD